MTQVCEKDIKFVGVDGLPHEGQIYVKQGILAASFEYPTCGKEAIDVALDILNVKDAPKKIVLPSRLLIKKTIE